MVVVVEGDV
jgi:hypothetical protein